MRNQFVAMLNSGEMHLGLIFQFYTSHEVALIKDIGVFNNALSMWLQSGMGTYEQIQRGICLKYRINTVSNQKGLLKFL